MMDIDYNDEELTEQIQLLFQHLNITRCCYGNAGKEYKGYRYLLYAVGLSYRGVPGNQLMRRVKEEFGLPGPYNLSQSFNPILLKAHRTRRKEYDALMQGCPGGGKPAYIRAMAEWLRRYRGEPQGADGVVWSPRPGGGEPPGVTFKRVDGERIAIYLGGEMLCAYSAQEYEHAVQVLLTILQNTSLYPPQPPKE